MALAVCARDVKFYGWPSIHYVGTYEVPIECMSVRSISWCCDGSSLLAVKSKGDPMIVKAPTKSETRISSNKLLSMSNVCSGRFSKISKNLIALGMENGDVSTYNLDTKILLRYKKLPTGIQNLDISPNDRNLLAGCLDGNIFLYDVKGRPSASFMVPNCYSLSTTLFSNYSNLFAGASKDGTFALWNSDTTDMEFCRKEHSARITDIAFLENTVTSISTDGFLCVFDLRSHELISKNNLEGALSSLAYFPGSYDLAIGTYNQLRSYDVRNLNTPVRTLLINNGGHIKSIAASPCRLESQDISSSDHMATKKQFEEDFSGSGDFSINSNTSADVTSDSLTMSEKSCHKPSLSSNIEANQSKTFKLSEIKELEKFINDYMKYCSAQFSEKMAQSFYALRIDTSKQFICMGEKMEDSWNNFISYLRFAGDQASDRGSTCCSKDKSEKEFNRPK